jgi:hypothetical protein
MVDHWIIINKSKYCSLSFLLDEKRYCYDNRVSPVLTFRLLIACGGAPRKRAPAYDFDKKALKSKPRKRCLFPVRFASLQRL